jgi:uncharacterized protein YciI
MHIADPRQVPSGLFLYTLRPVRLAMLTDGATSDEQALAARHWAYSQDLLRDGTLIFAGRTMHRDPTTFAFAVVRAPSLDEARILAEHDPAVAGGVFTDRSLSVPTHAHGCVAGRGSHNSARA